MTENTFRPPFYHRNAATELNGIVTGPSTQEVFSCGGLFLTPPHSPHGVSAETVTQAERATDKPVKLGTGSRWMQLESTFPMQVSPWALHASHRDPSFGDAVRRIPKRFDLNAR